MVVKTNWTAEFTGCYWENQGCGVWLSEIQEVLQVKETIESFHLRPGPTTLLAKSLMTAGFSVNLNFSQLT